MPTRRKFISNATCVSCSVVLLGITGSLASCSPVKVFMSVGKSETSVNVPLSAFKGATYQVIARKGEANVFIKKVADNEFQAFSMRCTHKGTKLKVDDNKILRCPLHGSQFDFGGKVLRGPAESPLKSYKTEVNDQEVTVFFS